MKRGHRHRTIVERIVLACAAFVTALVLSLATPAHAAEVAHFGERTSQLDIAPAVEVVVDQDQSLDAEAVSRLPSSRFRHASGPHPSFGFMRAALWFRFVVDNDSAIARSAVLDVGREWLADVDLYVDDGRGLRFVAHSGSFVPLRQRPIATERIAIPLTLAPHAHATYLLRMRGPTPLAFDAMLWDAVAFHQHDGVEEALFGIYYGILLALAAYSFLLFTALRERSQLIAGIVLTAWTLGEACAHGHVARFFPFGAGEIETRGPAVAFSISAGTVFTWMRTFLPFEHGSREERFDRILLGLIVAVVAAPVLFPTLSVLTYAGLTVFAIAIIFESIRALRRGNRSARFFALAVGAWTSGGFGGLGVFFGVFPAYAAIEYGAHIGAVTMALLFSLLLVDAIRSDRERIVSLHGETKTLNTALESQLAKVEANVKAIDTLNTELSFQVAARSRELVELLARQETLSVGRVLEPGEVFEGRYRVVRTLGAGAWGVVYEVERTTDARRLALKLVTRASSGAEAARVAREAEIGARVRHPNLVAIVDVGVALGTCPFLVMELVTGGSLESHRETFGDPQWALPLLAQIARGIGALHAAQIVHRDVKPANILVEEGETSLVARVADFGIARPDEHVDPLGATVAPGTRRSGPKLTQAEAFVGTPLYMPPEAARSGGAGLEGDVFAFGVVAYEMLTGEGPYPGATVFLALAGEDLPAPRSLSCDGVDRRVLQCIERCVGADPAMRPSMREIEELLSARAAPIALGA